MNAMYEESVEDFNSTLLSRPNDLRAYFNRAVVLEKLGKLEPAQRDCDRVNPQSI